MVGHHGLIRTAARASGKMVLSRGTVALRSFREMGPLKKIEKSIAVTEDRSKIGAAEPAVKGRSAGQSSARLRSIRALAFA